MVFLLVGLILGGRLICKCIRQIDSKHAKTVCLGVASAVSLRWLAGRGGGNPCSIPSAARVLLLGRTLQGAGQAAALEQRFAERMQF